MSNAEVNERLADEWLVQFREKLAQQIEDELSELVGIDTYKKDANGQYGYNCCGCSSYWQIVEHAARIVREWEPAS